MAEPELWGAYVVQLACLHRAHVIATASGVDAPFVKSLGADPPLLSTISLTLLLLATSLLLAEYFRYSQRYDREALAGLLLLLGLAQFKLLPSLWSRRLA